MSESIYYLTNPQKSIWLTEQFYKGMSIENITGSVIFSQNVDFTSLKKAINLFVEKNDGFRLKIVIKDDTAMQYVDKFEEFDIETIPVETDKDVKCLEREMCDTPFNTIENPLFEFKIFKFPDGHGGFTLKVHHLISDAWTMGIVINKVTKYYEDLITIGNVSDEETPSYVEYIKSEKKYLSSENFKKDKLFWSNMFENVPEVATIPSNIANSEYSSSSKRKQFTIPKETINLINEFCKRSKASIFNFFMGVFSVYLSRVSGLDEFVIGTPILNRSNYKEKQTTGMFISNLPFKISINNDKLFSDFIYEMSGTFAQIFRHQKYPYQYLLQDLRAKESSIPNLYKILISYQNMRSNKQSSSIPYNSRWIYTNNIADDIDIHLFDVNDTGNIDIAYDYLISKYSIDDICSIHARILHIINQILENSEICLKDIEIVTPDEKHKILYEFNNTASDYPKDKTISQLFEEQVEKTPDNIAVVFEEQKLTYKELNERANSLANYLIDNGIKANDSVAIFLDKSLEMIIAVLSILKAGAIYVPIDINYPDNRINFMLKDCSAKLVLTTKQFSLDIDFDHCLSIDLNNNFIYGTYPTNNPNVKSDLAYIMYTSGSTGNPKGVLIEQKSIIRLVKNTNYINFNNHERILQTGSIVFDACTFEIWASLLNGFELYIIRKSDLLDPSKLKTYLENYKITILWLTAPLLNQLSEKHPDMFKNVNYLLTGGDVLSPKHINLIRKNCPNLTIINGYGPTENTTFSTCFTIDNTYQKDIPIGYPISNSTCYILSKDMNLLPIGVPGELFVGGDGVAKGYINNSNFTKLKFIKSIFNDDFLYKTGDLVKWSSNGSIEFIGRIDGQVKINGFRVELNEINSKILEFHGIDNAFTTIKMINNEKFICSYIISTNTVNINSLKKYLADFLPKYSIPTYFVLLDQLPINTNGKVDSAKLPIPQTINVKKNIIKPRNDIDIALISTLKSILNINDVSIDDSFFELGGDSLTAITLCTKLYAILNIDISVKDIMENPVIQNLSNIISSRKTFPTTKFIKKCEKVPLYSASSAQKRLFYSTQSIENGNNVVNNVSGGLLVDSVLDINKIRTAMNKIIEMQSGFRTQFKVIDGELFQVIINHAEIKIDYLQEKEESLSALINSFPKPFDLSCAPLLRVCVYILDNKKTLILLDSHHIVIDGASLNILIDEFCKLYNGNTIDKLNFEYIDYSEWEKDFIESDDIKDYDEYWSNTFSNAQISSLNLPYDFPAASKSYNGDKISYNMKKETFEQVENFAKEHNVSSYTVFLSALYILLYKYTSQTDIIIGSPLEGRNFEELSNIIGMFVNNIVLKNNINGTNTVEEFLRKTQDIVSGALSNQPYPYELLLKKLKLDHNTSLLDVVLTYQNTKKANYNIDNSNMELIYANTKTAKFNIWIEIIPDLAKFNLEYNSSLFKKETIESFLEHYIFIIDQLISNSNTSIDNIEIITEKEKHLLEKFNNTYGPINNDTVVSLFEEQVKLNANNIAVICNNKTLTYDELNKKANSLAHLLIEKGIGANDIVCIMTNRSFETIVCMMAILKAGAAFFNVDPNYPIERTKYYLEDSKTKYVLTQSELKETVSSIENCIEIDLNLSDIYNKNFENPNIDIKPNDLSYLIYTSGSTGKPKGTMLNQVGFANMAKAMTLVLDYLKEGNKHCIASVTSTPFDIFVYEIIVSLTHGLKIAMANNAEHRNPKLLDELIRKCNVDVMTVTPSLMKINYDNREPNTALAMVKNMVFGGEPLPEKFVEDLRALSDDITIYNIYGPSEITILSNVQNLDGETEITTGPPIMNTQIHILDKNMKRVPIGVVGEIYISGIQVGLGYIGKPELTAEKFLDNPFGKGKMYKSGDIGRWTFDGKVQCLGRIDHQIKLRGLRIELGEIENVMLGTEGVSSAVVNKIEIDGKEALCGYYTCEQDVSENTIKDVLRKALPAYMVPTYIVKLEQMPYTINRKIDRKALPLPELNKPVANNKINIEELNSTEEKLLQIWKNILKIDDIDINDNFFDIGGDSVAAISMQIEAVKYGLEFEYGDIFTFPTIKQLSANLKSPDEIFIKNYDYTKVNSILARNTVENLKTIKKANINNILLIGSTGYIGAHIVDAFLKNNKGTIYCLVRRKDNVDIEQRLKNILSFYFGNTYNSFFGNRIKVIYGDIIEKNLGLSQEDFSLLRDDIDVVINSGALVKHFGIKKKFEEINVKGTQNVIDFCLATNKRLLHVSTISVSGNGEKEETVIETPENINDKKIFRETDIYVGQNIKGVYSTTKFRAELLVLEAIADKNLDAQILRLGNITNRYSDGAFQMNTDENAFAKRIKSFAKIGAFPKYMLKHAIELTPVDLAAEAIIKIANFTTRINVIHIYNTKLMPIALFINTLSDFGINLLPVSDIMMKDIITGILSDNSRKDILSGIIYDLDENKQLIYTSNIRLNCDFTSEFFKKINFKWKSIDKNYIIKYMNYFEKINFIKKEEN